MAEYTDAGIAEAVAASEKKIRVETAAATAAASQAVPAAEVDETAIAARAAEMVMRELEASGKLAGGGAAPLPKNVLTYSYDGTEIKTAFYEPSSDPDAEPVLIGHDVIVLNHGNQSFKRKFRRAD